MKKVSHHATTLSLISVGDIVFSGGEMPANPKMYIVCSGSLEYQSMSTTERFLCGRANYIAEPTLWTEWTHLGTLVASTNCRVCILDASIFQQLAAKFDYAGIDRCADPFHYSDEFIIALNDTINADNRNDMFHKEWDREGGISTVAMRRNSMDQQRNWSFKQGLRASAPRMSQLVFGSDEKRRSNVSERRVKNIMDQVVTQMPHEEA